MKKRTSEHSKSLDTPNGFGHDSREKARLVVAVGRCISSAIVIVLLVGILALCAWLVRVGPQFLADMYDVIGGNTIFAPGYADKEWAKVRVGDSKQQVLQALGRPLQEIPVDSQWLWTFEDKAIDVTVTLDWETGESIVTACTDRNSQQDTSNLVGLSSEALWAQFGPPTGRRATKKDIGMLYSLPQGGLGQGNYMQRTLYVDGSTSRVVAKSEGLYGD